MALAATARSGALGLGADRGDLVEIQRARIVTALVQVAAERGLGEVTVADVVARSGVSRRTFYELFADRDDCVLAAFDQALQRAARRVAPAFRAPGSWRERMRAALAELLALMDDDRALATLCVVDATVAGPAVLECRERAVRTLIAAVDEGREAMRGETRPTALMAEGVVGAVLAVLHARLAADRPNSTRKRGGPRHGRTPEASMTDLLGPLMEIVVLPYLGRAAAAKEAARPAPTRRREAPPRGDPLHGLDMRLTYRTVRVLLQIASRPGASNRQIADGAGVHDQGQISKLLTRLEHLGLIANRGTGGTRGEANAWSLTIRGEQLAAAISEQALAGRAAARGGRDCSAGSAGTRRRAARASRSTARLDR